MPLADVETLETHPQMKGKKTMFTRFELDYRSLTPEELDAIRDTDTVYFYEDMLTGALFWSDMSPEKFNRYGKVKTFKTQREMIDDFMEFYAAVQA